MTVHNPRYHELNQAGKAMGEQNDCTVIALAVACDLDYETAHKTMATIGKRPFRSRGHWENAWVNYRKAVEASAASVEPITLESRTVRTARRELLAKYPGKRVILNVRGHTLAWDGRDIADWTNNRLHRINEAWLVTPKDKVAKPKPEPKPAPVKPIDRLSRAANLSVWNILGVIQ